MGRRLAAAAVALAVFAAAAVFAWDLSHPAIPPPEPGVDLGSELPVGWSELPAPPEVRTDAAMAWTGSRLLVWGGYEYTGHGDGPLPEGGLSFDAGSRRWGDIPQGPLFKRADPAFAWTGRELLIWGGWDGGFRDDHAFGDGAAYDPVDRSWRMLPPAPLSARRPFSVWTDRELIVWGSIDRSARMRDGAAYDPSTDTWRTIAEAPVEVTDGSAVWTGTEMIVFGAALDGNNRADTEMAIGVAYDPANDTWRELPSSNLSPQAMTAAWTGHELVAWDYGLTSATYDPEVDAWRSLERVPLDDSECVPASVGAGRTVLGDYCGRPVVFSPEEDAWHRERLPTPEGGCCRLNELVAAGDVALVLSHATEIQTLRPGDRRMFAYNPPAMVRTDPTGEILQPEPFIPQVERDGDLLRMPVTFPDGTDATVVYPIPLDLATRGLFPRVSYEWRADPPPKFPIVFLHDPNASITEYVEGSEPVGVVNSYRSIEIWKFSDFWLRHRAVLQGHWLRYRLPDWTVLVAIGPREDADRVAANLSLEQTSGGYPVATPSGPLALASLGGEGEGPELSIGPGFGDPDEVDDLIDLWTGGCSGPVAGDLAPSKQYYSRCFDGRISMNVSGDPPFVRAVRDGVTVRYSQPVQPTPFVPIAHVTDGIARVPVTFPDGSSATLAYPASLNVATLGVQPDVSYRFLDDPEHWFPIVFLHDPDASLASFVDLDAGSRLVNTSGGGIEIFRARENDAGRRFWIRFELRSWTVLVSVQDQLTSAVTVAGGLELRETSAGFPVLSATGPLALQEGHSDAGGPQLAFGDRIPDPGRFSNDTMIVLFPFPCTPGSEQNPSLAYGSSCLAQGDVFASISGDQGFVSSVVEGLRVEDFRQA
jgi:hypothetical protein